MPHRLLPKGNTRTWFDDCGRRGESERGMVFLTLTFSLRIERPLRLRGISKYLKFARLQLLENARF